MIDATSSPCFLVREGDVLRRASLLEILTKPGLTLSGPTPLLEAIQLQVAASLTADVLDGYHDGDLSDIAAEVARRIEAHPGRHLLDGDGFRYRQVRIENGESETGSNMVGQMFPNFAPLTKDGDDQFKFGWRGVNDWHGLCPCCTLLGLTFVACFSGGSGGKVAGVWKNGVMTFPILSTLSETVVLNALAWDPDEELAELGKLASLGTRVSADPWSDPVYVGAVAGSKNFDDSFKTISHLRALVPWAVWAGWEEVADHPCALCGLPSDVLCTSIVSPVKEGGDYKQGKMGWPKSSEGVTDVPPSPHHASPFNDEGKPLSISQSVDLISVSKDLFNKNHAARVLKLALKDDLDIGDNGQKMASAASLMVVMISNDHQGKVTVGRVAHIPIKSRRNEMYVRCSALYDASREIEGLLRTALNRILFKLGESDKVRVRVCVDSWRMCCAYFTDYLGEDDLPKWTSFLRKEALKTFDMAALPLYEQGHNPKTKEPLGKIAAYARMDILRSKA